MVFYEEIEYTLKVVEVKTGGSMFTVMKKIFLKIST